MDKNLRFAIRNPQLAITIAVFIIALLPRLLPPNEFITADELVWQHRAIRFRAALRRGDWTGTFQTGHPGVLTMWLGALGISTSGADESVLNALAQSHITNHFHVILTQSENRTLAGWLPAAKRFLPWAHALCLAVMYLLLTRLFDKSAAFYGTILAATAPFHVALSRVLHLDALLASLMGLAVLSFLVYLSRLDSNLRQLPVTFRSDGQLFAVPYLFLTSIFAALATLNKTPALFLAPFFALLYLISAIARLGQRRAPRAEIKNLQFVALSLGVAAIVFVLLFPAMWTRPLETIRASVGKAVDYAAHTDDVAFFVGRVSANPGGAALYPVVWWFKTTPLTIVGLLGLALCGWRKPERYRIVALLLYAVSFGAFITLSIKNFPRYLLPSLMAIDIAAGVGISYWIDFLTQKARGTHNEYSLTAPRALVLLTTGALLGWYHPYYFAYYNPLAGGSAQAVKTIAVGWGEGLEKAAQYLNEQPAAREVASGYSSSFVPFFKGNVVNLGDYNPATVDYFIFYVSQVQRQLYADTSARYLGKETPEKVIRIHGIDYVWIYRNEHFRDIVAHIEPRADEGDAIVLPTHSNFADYYHGALPYYTVKGNDAEIRTALAEIAARHRRVWYIAYPKFGEKVTYHLKTQCYQLTKQTFPDATVYAYALPDSEAFAAAPSWQDASADFGGKFQLLKYRITPTAAWRRDVGVNARWRLDTDAEKYRVFLHLMDEAGHRWGQYDAPLQSRYTVPIIAGTPRGEYELQMGIYRWSTGERLALTDGTGTTYSLGRVRVESSPLTPTLADLEIAVPLSRDVAAGLHVLGYNLPITTARPGDFLPLTIFWQATWEISNKDFGSLQLRTADGVIIATAAYSLPHQWRSDEIIRGQYDLFIPSDVTDSAAQLWLSVAGVQGFAPLLLSDITIATVPRSFTPPPITNKQTANLGDTIQFIGYDLGEVGATVPITLYWHARQPMTTSYTVFVHLLNAAGQVVGQRDLLPVNGARPTTGWAPGEYITDTYEIPSSVGAQQLVPIGYAAPLQTGEYAIEIGMYDAATGERVPVYDDAGNEMPDRRILLTQRVIVAP